MATAVDTPVLAGVTCDSTVEIPTTAVDSEDDRLVKALRPEDTWALVGTPASTTIVEIAVENNAAKEMVLDRLVLSSVAPERAVETTTPAEVVVESAADVIAESDVWLDLAVLDEVESAVLSERLPDTWVVCEAWADNSLEIVVDIELSVPSTVDTEPVIVRLEPSTPFRTFVVG